jgi:hypothetical protein
VPTPMNTPAARPSSNQPTEVVIQPLPVVNPAACGGDRLLVPAA